MNIENLVKFLREKLGNDSKVTSVEKDKRKDLGIETQQKLKQEVLVGLVRKFYQKDYKVIDTSTGLIVNDASVTITASDISSQNKPPPFYSFITINY